MTEKLEINTVFVRTAFLVLACVSGLLAQGGGGRGTPPGQSPRTPKQTAPADLTGYWVSVVVEDWKYRMLPANKGDYSALALTPAGMKAAESWNPAKEPPALEDCRNYGAANLMRQPGRLHITWEDDQTLKVDSDAGTQTRLLSFGPAKGKEGPGGWQGVSVATWDGIAVGRGPNQLTGSLKVVTTGMKPGFLRSNGVPYSSNAVLTEYFDRIEFPDGNNYLVVTTTVEDPIWLATPYRTSVHFRKQADNAGWNPRACH
jgi:hypothetical protein